VKNPKNAGGEWEKLSPKSNYESNLDIQELEI
jgi:hypothetical protein